MRRLLTAWTMLLAAALAACLFGGSCGGENGAGTTYKLTIQTTGQGNVACDPQGDTHESGTAVTLTATSSSGWSFSHWEGDLSGSSETASVTMDGEKTVKAVFVTTGGVVMAKVSAVDGSAIPTVAVELDNGTSGSTDDSGYFAFSIPAGKTEVVAHLTKNGFAPTSKRLTVQAHQSACPISMVMAPAGETVTISSGQSNTHRTDKSAVTIPANSLVQSNGQKVTGSVELTVTHLDPSTDEVLAFPGSFGAATNSNGQSTALESFGFASYQLTQNGQPVNLASGSKAQIEYVLPANAQARFKAGDTIPLWHFNSTTATWEESGHGTVGLATDGSGMLAWFATVSHFSDWNCDQEAERHCITGRLMTDAPDPDDASPLAPLVPTLRPLAGAQVSAVGLTYNGVDTGMTDANGRFCVYGKAGESARIDIRVNGAPQALVFDNQTFAKLIVVLPDNRADCGGSCVDIGEVAVRMNSAIKGTVKDKNGSPVSGVKVHAAPGSVTTTDADGSYCVRCVGGMQACVFAEGWSAVEVTTPATADCDGAVSSDLTISLPTSGATLGTLTVSKSVSYMMIQGQLKTFSSLSMNGMFFLADSTRGQNISMPGISVTTEESGTCSVTTLDLTQTISDQQIPSVNVQVGALDPGEPGTATNGTKSEPLIRDDSVDAGKTWLRGFFALPDGVDALADGFNAGQTVAISFPGGTDIGAFSGSVSIPADLKVTSPNLAAPATTLNLSGPLQLSWQAGNAADTVEATVSGSTTEMLDNGDGTQTNTTHMVTVQCDLPDTGSGSISGDLMARIPADSTIIVLSLRRTRHAEVSAPLKRVSGDGVVKLVGGAGVSRAWQN